MTGNVDPDLMELRAALADAAKIEDLAERSLEVVAVVEAAGAPLGIHPVVVGGMAVYFWTADEAFVTRDIDVLMAVPESSPPLWLNSGSRRAGTGVTGTWPGPTSSSKPRARNSSRMRS